MSKILWKANSETKLKSNLYRFEKFITKKFDKKFNKKYEKILNWSIKNPGDFWSSIWDFCKVKGIKSNYKIKKSKIFYKNIFLPNSSLNFAQNLLSKKTPSKAITFLSENGFREERAWKDLHNNVSKLQVFFNRIKLLNGNRVAAYTINSIETVEAFLATASIGAVWSSCSPDFGVKGVIQRFAQIKPKVLFVTDRYYYNGKEINILERVPEILKKIKSIKYLIIINYPGKNFLKKNIKFKRLKVFFWNDLKKIASKKIYFKKFDFEHELAILYSSGTTGRPKCICHKNGGVLLQHLKEHQLHCDIKEGDNIFYFTTSGWMMWNWLVSCLASKASIVLFDGFPMFKKNDLLLKIADKEKITLMGVSAKYIDSLYKLKIKNKYKLKNLRTICSTGSPLSKEGFEYIYKNLKKNVHLSSISGGTDIISCFVLGNLYEPVISGEIQNKGLAMNVKIFDENGKILKNKKGELVCINPFPSMPLKFWNDKKDEKFKKAYFNKYKNIWHHGDFCEKTENNGFIIYGRSDATLNAGGVRFGTAELYRVVENIDNIIECVAVEHSIYNDTEVILFIKAQSNFNLNDDLIKLIKFEIKSNLSPKHVPRKIFQVKDIPKTKSGKIVELTIKNIINGLDVKNKNILANPDCLKEFENIYKEIKLN